jgi:MFS family permease
VIPFWIPNLVKEASVGLAEAAIRARTSDATMAIHVGTLLGVLCFPLLAQRIGRRKAFGLFFLLSPIVTALALYGGTDYPRLLLLLPIATFFSIGVSAGFVLYFPELFPTRLRATGAGLGYNVGRIFSAPIPWLTGIAIAALNGSVAAGVLVAASIYVVGLVTLPFAPETGTLPADGQSPGN